MPIKFFIDDAYIPAYDLELQDMVANIKARQKTPLIKGVSTEKYAKVFEKHINQGMEILCITAGDSFVSNYSCACHASTLFPKANIHI